MDYSWMYTATSDEIQMYFKKQEKLQIIRDSALEALLKINFGSKGYSYKFFDCQSGEFYDVIIYGNGIYEQFVVHHDNIFDEVRKINKEVERLKDEC